MRNLTKCAFIIKIILLCGLTSNALADIKNLQLSQQQISDFHTNGIIVIPNFFNKKEVTLVLTLANKLQQTANKNINSESSQIMYHGAQIALGPVNDKNELLWVFAAGAAEPQLLSLARQKKLLIPVSQLLNSDTAEQLINLLQYRFPNGGSGENFFQDIKYRKTANANWQDINGKGSFVLCLIALEPLNITTGTIYYVPKSHLRGDLQLEKITTAEELYNSANLETALPLSLNPGDLVIWHPYLVHGNFNKKFSVAKRLFINAFAYPGANGAQTNNTTTIKLLP